MEIVKFNLKDKNELLELDKECFGVNHWDNELWQEILGDLEHNLMLTVEAIGKKITTIEGIENAPVQKAFVESFGFQCGYCTSGFLMVCHALAKIHPEANEHVIEQWLQSNICRCTGYAEIEEAVKAVLSGKTIF